MKDAPSCILRPALSFSGKEDEDTAKADDETGRAFDCGEEYDVEALDEDVDKEDEEVKAFLDESGDEETVEEAFDEDSCDEWDAELSEEEATSSPLVTILILPPCIFTISAP